MFKSKTTISQNHNKRKHPKETMDEHMTSSTSNTTSTAYSLILHGCKLAKELESNLAAAANHQPDTLAEACDEIAKIFGGARDRLRGRHGDDQDNMFQRPAQKNNLDHASNLLQEWIGSNNNLGYTQPLMDINIDYHHRQQPQFLHLGDQYHRDYLSQMRGSVEFLASSSAAGGQSLIDISSVSGKSSGTTTNLCSSSSQRPRRRKDDSEIRIVKMAAPQIGNTDIPPEDNYTWRKYGQKDIMGSKYPRGYYRCTHQKLYRCPAKKQVQRLDDDPYTFEVMYRGHHTCHMSATAPTLSDVSPLQAVILSHSQNNNEITSTQHAMVASTDHQPLTTISTTTTTTSSVPLGRWLSMEFSSLAGTGTTAAAGTSTGAGASSSTSTLRYGKEIVESPVVDMADVMFNSGSSSSNSMDFLFSTGEDKLRDSGNKKNAPS